MAAPLYSHTPTRRAHHASDRTRLRSALPLLPLEDIRRLPFETSPHGYRRLTIARTGACEIVALHWPAGSRSPLHGHASSAALLHVVEGMIVEDRFAPRYFLSSSPFSYQRERIGAGGTAYLPSGAFHAVEALEESWGLHAYTPELKVPTAEVPMATRVLLEQAWRDAVGAVAGPVPPFLR